jgi:hypothetical protein
MVGIRFGQRGVSGRVFTVRSKGEKRLLVSLIQPITWHKKCEVFTHTSPSVFLKKSRFQPDNLKMLGKSRLAGCYRIVLSMLTVSLVTAGCSWTDKGGTHHLIVGIGFGVITTTNAPGVSVYESHVIGGELGPNFASLGWMQHHRVELDPSLTNNVVISINSHRYGLTVTNFNPNELYTNLFIQTQNSTNQIK